MALAIVGCVAPLRHEPPVGYGAVADQAASSEIRQVGARASILSAHLGVDGDGDEDALIIVFSRELDPLTVAPARFAVLLRDGNHSRPTDAVLAPASESDENRTVVLHGDFGSADGNPPTHVTVSGRLHAEDGALLTGLGAEVRGFSEPETVVFAEVVSGSQRACPDTSHAVRTYWTDTLRDVTVDDLDNVSMPVQNREFRPASFDDHPVGGDEGAADNVLDLCVDSEGAPTRLRISAGAFADSAGHPSADVDVAIYSKAQSCGVSNTRSRSSRW